LELDRCLDKGSWDDSRHLGCKSVGNLAPWEELSDTYVLKLRLE